MTAVEPLLTPAEVAEALRVSERWVRERAAAEAIPHVRLGRYRRFRRQDLDVIRERFAVTPRERRTT